MKTLTKRTRYRTLVTGLLFRKVQLVLQVQEHTTDGPPDFHGLPTYLAGTYWRDATVEDLSTLFSNNNSTEIQS